MDTEVVGVGEPVESRSVRKEGEGAPSPMFPSPGEELETSKTQTQKAPRSLFRAQVDVVCGCHVRQRLLCRWLELLAMETTWAPGGPHPLFRGT